MSDTLKVVLGYFVLFSILVLIVCFLFKKQIREFRLKRYHERHVKNGELTWFDCVICERKKENEQSKNN